VLPGEVIRATRDEKQYQIHMLEQLHKTYENEAKEHLNMLKQKAVHNENIFEGLMEASKYCSIGQISHALFEVGGQYRRNM
jgi:methylmalonyl-CoA mutase